MKKSIGVREIAGLANVSIGTVDRALNGRKEIGEKTRERILKIANKYGYQPNQAARALSVSRRRLRVGVSIPREIHYFYDQLRDGIFEEARRFRHMNLEILYQPVDRLGDNNASGIEELLERGIKALILVPGDPEAAVPLIDHVEKECDVRVVCVATDSSASRRSTIVSVEPHLNGMLAGELMGKLLARKSRVAIFTGMLSTEDHKRKVDGFVESFRCECPGGVVTEVIEGHEDEAETFNKCRDLLRRDGALAGIYVSTANCLPVCRALEAAGRAGNIRLIATDLFAEAARYVENRTITASMYQRPYRQGQVAVRMIADYFATGEKLPQTRYLTPGIVFRSNLQSFRESGAPGLVPDERPRKRKTVTT
jgi:LacI family transcriptional regulator